MSKLIKDLGAVSAYAYAVEKGYTGTEDEFAELMYDYTDVAQTAVEAKDEAVSASASAQASATTANTKADEASASASKAQSASDSAQGAETNAETFALNAGTKATEAKQFADKAELNAQKTQSDKEAVESAKSDVLSAVDNAQNYADSAQLASQAIQNMDVEATTLEPDSDATVEKTVDAISGAVTLTYGIPKGQVGEKGDKGDTGDSGVYIGTSAPSDENVNVWIDSDGEPDDVIQIDDTLTQSGQAADAKKTGDEITSLKEDLTKIDNGLNDISGVFHYDDFAVGALSKSNSIITFDSTDKRMVSTPKSICFPVDITIVPADGYRMYIHWTDGRPYSTSNTGWVTSPITVNANQWFMMTLRKVASDTVYEANAIDFVNKFSVTPSPLRIAEDAVFHKKTVYVSTGGSDETGVGTLGNPYKTFAKAISVGAEHIVARSGTYNEAISINGGDIRISAYWETFVSGRVTNRPKIIIDGANTIKTALTIENCSNVILEDVLVRNCTNDGAIINKCDYVDIQNCEFSNNGRNGIIINYSNGVIKNSYGNSNGNDGFNMNYFGDTQFYNCGGHDNGDDGISHHQGTTGSINGGEWYNNVKGGIASPAHGAKVDIYNVYSHNNGYGIYANADTDTVARTFRIWNSVLTNNSRYGLTSKRNTAILYNCKITGNTEGQTTAPSGGSIITL